MADMTVNIARALLHEKVCPDRPPSGKNERERIINNYARQLTSASARNIRHNSAKKNKDSSGNNPRLFIKVEPPAGHPRNGNSSCELNGRSSIKTSRPGQRRVQSAKARLVEPDKVTTTHKKRAVQSAKVRWGPNHVVNSRSTASTADSSAYSGFLNSRSWLSESDLLKDSRPLKSCLKSASKSSISDKSSSKLAEDLTDEALGVVEDDEDTDEDTSDTEGELTLPLPKTLRPLAHYWTPDIPPQYLGIDHLRCWVFLPSMVENYDELPIVPAAVTDPTEELPFKDKIEKSPPWTKRPVENWNCKHHHGASSSVPPLKIYDTEGKVMHETTRQARTIGIVRKEIEELELLMKGIGSADGCSIVVQYQYEITKLQKMVDNTLGRVEEIERREREKLKAMEAQQKDYCGLRKFYKEHDDVMRQIRLQHSKCVRELAILERDLKIDSSRAHFRKGYGDQL